MKNNSAQFSIPRLNNVMLNALNNILKNTIYNEKLKMATFTRVDINKSKTLAKIYVDTIKRERIDNLVLLLNKNVATFRYELAKIVSMWKIPELVFYRDYEIDQQNEMKQLFNDIKKREKTLRLAREKLFSTKKN